MIDNEEAKDVQETENSRRMEYSDRTEKSSSRMDTKSQQAGNDKLTRWMEMKKDRAA